MTLNAGMYLEQELSGLLGGACLWLLHSTQQAYSRAAPTLLPSLLGTLSLPWHMPLQDDLINR